MTRILPGARYRCADCGRDLSGTALAVPCLCGSTYRLRIDSDETLYRMPDRPGLPRFDPFKDWEIKYLQLSWNVSQLAHAYRSGIGFDAGDVRRIVEMAFASCADLGGWLVSGPEPHTVTPGDIDRFMQSDPVRLCKVPRDQRSATDGESIRLVPVAFAPTPRFWVEHTRPGNKPMRFDSLDLAERWLDAWTQFLAGYGVAVPTWEH